MQKAPDNTDVKRSLQNCGSIVRNLLSVWRLEFGGGCYVFVEFVDPCCFNTKGRLALIVGGSLGRCTTDTPYILPESETVAFRQFILRFISQTSERLLCSLLWLWSKCFLPSLVYLVWGYHYSAIKICPPPQKDTHGGSATGAHVRLTAVCCMLLVWQSV